MDFFSKHILSVYHKQALCSSDTYIKGWGSGEQSRNRKEGPSTRMVSQAFLLSLTYYTLSQWTVRWQYTEGNINTTDPKKELMFSFQVSSCHKIH